MFVNLGGIKSRRQRCRDRQGVGLDYGMYHCKAWA